MMRRASLLAACAGLIASSAMAVVPVKQAATRYNNYVTCAAYMMVAADTANDDSDMTLAKSSWARSKEFEARATPALEALDFTQLELEEDISIMRLDIEDKYAALNDDDYLALQVKFSDHCDGVYEGKEDLDKELKW